MSSNIDECTIYQAVGPGTVEHIAKLDESAATTVVFTFGPHERGSDAIMAECLRFGWVWQGQDASGAGDYSMTFHLPAGRQRVAVQWQYQLASVNKIDWQAMGNKGWELVAVCKRTAYFKRQRVCRSQ